MIKQLNAIWFVQPALFALAKSNEQETGATAVEGIATKSSDQQYSSLVTGESDFAITSMDNVMDWNLRDPQHQFLIVAQIEKTTPLTLTGKPGLNDLTDLKKGVLLVDAPENGFVVAARSYLEDNGVSFDSYKLDPAGGVKERYESLMQGQGDVTLLGPPFDALAAAAGAPILAKINDSYPDFPGQGVVILASRLRQLESELKTFMAQLSATSQKALQDKVASVEALEKHGFPLPAAKAMATHLPETLTPSKVGIDLLIAQRNNVGLRGADTTYNDLVDLRLLEA